MNWCENFALAWRLIPLECASTLYMVGVSAFFAFWLGLSLGICLRLTDREGLAPSSLLYRTLGMVVNMGRAIPFAILLIVLFPLTRWVVGTSIGTTASIVPLTIAAIPFFARVTEAAFKEVSPALLEAALVMGSTTRHIVQKVLIPEALPSIVRGVTLMVINLIGYSAMAGLVGGGGLGKVAIQYGYQRFNTFLMLVTLLVILLLVEGVQWVGNRVVEKIVRRRGVL